MLMALLFAIIFAAIGMGVSFLFSRFLDMDSGSGDGDVSGESASDGTKKGQIVDVVIRDEDLPSDEVTGQYMVGSNRHMLTDSDISSSGSGFAAVTPQAVYQNAAASKSAMANANAQALAGGENSFVDQNPAEQFVPVRNLETLYNVSGKESVSQTDKPEAGASTGFSSGAERKYSAEDEDLDTLPSMEGMEGIADIGNGSSSSGGNDGFNNETEFATSGFSSGGSHRSEASETEIKDAPLMAKAISSILASES